MKLPEGIRREGGRLHIDLERCEPLQRRDGVVELPKLRLVLVRGKVRVHAFGLTCPHKPKKGYCVRQQRESDRPAFRCSAHGWTWDRKGRPTGKAKKRLRRLPVVRDGDAVVVEL